jgi:hypothetical protein
VISRDPKPGNYLFGKKEPGRARRRGDPPDYFPSFATLAACRDLASCSNLAEFVALPDSWRARGNSAKPPRL